MRINIYLLYIKAILLAKPDSILLTLKMYTSIHIYVPSSITNTTKILNTEK